MLPVNPGEEFRPHDEEAKADSIRAQQQDQDDQRTMTMPTTSPTPRTDAYESTYAQARQCIQRSQTEWLTLVPTPFARQLESELTLAQASLATAQAACVVKDEALRSLENYARLNPPHPDFPIAINRFSLITNSQLALADNCAAPVTAKLARMRTALHMIKARVVGDRGERWKDDLATTITRGIIADDCDKALEDQ